MPKLTPQQITWLVDIGAWIVVTLALWKVYDLLRGVLRFWLHKQTKERPFILPRSSKEDVEDETRADSQTVTRSKAESGPSYVVWRR